MDKWWCSQLKSVIEGEAIWKVEVIHSFIFGPVEFKSAVGNPGFLEDKIPIFHSVSITASLFYSSAATSITIFSTVFLHKGMCFRIS